MKPTIGLPTISSLQDEIARLEAENARLKEQMFRAKWDECNAANARIAELEAITAWTNGCPPSPYGEAWFIAETIYGDRVVLKELPKEFTYDYKTADETYFMRRNIAKWMQFPDSQYRPYAADRIAELEATVAHLAKVADEKEAQAEQNAALWRELEAENARLKEALRRAAGDPEDIILCPNCGSTEHTFHNNGPKKCMDCAHKWV